MSTQKIFACHKMVRGHEAQWMLKHNIMAKTQPIPEDQKEGWIKKKLKEESGEVTTAHTHAKSLSELIDVQESIDALLHVWGISPETFEKMCQEKRTLRGSYKDGILLTQVTLDETNEQYAHFADHPEKFMPIVHP